MQLRSLRLSASALLVLAAALLIGLLADALLLCLLLAAFLSLGWHYRNLYRLGRYLLHSRRFVPPEGQGSWALIYDGIYKLHQRHLRRRHELGELIRHFREGAEAMPDGVLVVGAHHSILWSNGMARRLLGLRWPDDQNQRLDNLIRSPEFKQFLHLDDHAEPLLLDSPVMAGHILELRLMPYGNQQRLLVLRDITRVRKLERVREDFIANVSHELRTPLTVLKGYLELCGPLEEETEVGAETVSELSNASLPPLPLAAWRMMSEQCQRMDSLVAQLSELSTIEAHASVDFSHIIDVPALLALLAEEARLLCAERRLTLQFEINPSLRMNGDARQMRSAFSNLITNAIKYTNDGGRIEVSWQPSRRGGLFLVRDNGEGIAAEHLHRLTERFYRVDQARTRKTGGSGLGLAIVKHALANHQSRLEVESSLGQGSCFSFVIPPLLLLDGGH